MPLPLPLNQLTDPLELPPAAPFHKIKGDPEFGDDITHISTSFFISPTTPPQPALHSGLPCPAILRLAETALLLPNSSHLETINTVALGKMQEKQLALLKSSDADETDLKPEDRMMDTASSSRASD